MGFGICRIDELVVMLITQRSFDLATSRKNSAKKEFSWMMLRTKT